MDLRELMATVLTQVFKADRGTQTILLRRQKNVIVFVSSTQCVVCSQKFLLLQASVLRAEGPVSFQEPQRRLGGCL